MLLSCWMFANLAITRMYSSTCAIELFDEHKVTVKSLSCYERDNNTMCPSAWILDPRTPDIGSGNRSQDPGLRIGPRKSVVDRTFPFFCGKGVIIFSFPEQGSACRSCCFDIFVFACARLRFDSISCVEVGHHAAITKLSSQVHIRTQLSGSSRIVFCCGWSGIIEEGSPYIGARRKSEASPFEHKAFFISTTIIHYNGSRFGPQQCSESE